MHHLRQSEKASKRATHEAGFTLVEMIVSIALFSVVMLVAVGTLLALTAADKKAEALQSVMNNLNVSIDSMVRNLRMGSQYHCGLSVSSVTSFAGDGSDDCSSSVGRVITFTCNTSVPGCSAGSRWSYGFDSTGATCGKSICKSVDGGSTWSPVTSPDVTISNMAFFVVGTKPGDTTQPKVIIVIVGTAGGGSAKTSTAFHIQATAVQRVLDL